MRSLNIALAVSLLSATLALAQNTEDLFAAARKGDVDAVRTLVSAGAEVDATNRYGSTALAMAASAGHLEVVRYLLGQGADADKPDDFYGASPLQMALFFSGHREVAMALLEAGAEGREDALGFALSQSDMDLARAALAGGPLHASRLAAFRAQAADLDPEIGALIEAAESRPDPEPPAYPVGELHAFTGRFEGWNSDTRADVALRQGRLILWVNDGAPHELTVVDERSFTSADETIQANFNGRAGTIEGIFLSRPGAEPELLRRSVAEPAADAGARITKAASGETATGTATVNWPSFRGSRSRGIGDGADTRTSWDLESGEGILWRTDIPGLGNSSPIVWGDHVFISTAVAASGEQTIQTGLTGSGTGVDEAVEHTWRVMSLDKGSGAKLWETEIGRAVPLTRRHFKATQANSTPVTDGKYLVVVFPTAGIACLDLDGNVLWKHDLGGLNAGAFTDPSQEWGFASSPIIHGSRVILQVDVHEGAYLAAWDLPTGTEIWRTERDVAPSWATPLVVAGPEGDELVVNGSTIHGYDPISGRELWSLGPNSELVVATPVVGDGVVYVSAGYPPIKPIYALRSGLRGDHEVVPGSPDERFAWSHGIGGAYMPTPILYRGLFYVVHHNGRIVAYDAASGEAVYKSRFSQGGVFTGSPVAVNGKLYLPTEEGLLYVLTAGPEFGELAVNDMGEPLMATPAISEGVLFLRTPSQLVAVGDRPAG